MEYLKHVFVGVKTADWDLAKSTCEALVEQPLKCTNSLFHGGDHCHWNGDAAGFDLRLNHHDDGWGWSWCIEDTRFPLVFSCTFYEPGIAEAVLGRLPQFPLLELPPQKERSQP